MTLENEPAPVSGKTQNQSTQPWPASLPEQVRAVAQVLVGQSGALTIADIETHFKGRGPLKKSLTRILEILEVLDRSRRESGGR